MSVVESLAAWGIVAPGDVVELAAAARLDVAVAATLLTMETGGGRNVWGHDRVRTGGAYTPGAEVTREAYLEYRTARAAGRAGPQGVGPCQLTDAAFQDQADRLGGCWVPRNNMRVGFLTLASLQLVHGVRDGFRRYNGSGAAAEAYAGKSVDLLARWCDRLGPQVSGADSLPTLREGDSGSGVMALHEFAVRVFPAYARFSPTGYYGPATVEFVAEFQRRAGITGPDADGRIVGPRTNAALYAAGFRGRG